MRPPFGMLELQHQLFDSAASQNSSCLDDGGRVADFGKFRQNVRADQNCLIKFASQQVNQFPQFNAGSRIKSGRWFIKYQHLRIVNQCATQSQSLR